MVPAAGSTLDLAGVCIQVQAAVLIRAREGACTPAREVACTRAQVEGSIPAQAVVYTRAQVEGFIPAQAVVCILGPLNIAPISRLGRFLSDIYFKMAMRMKLN